MGCHHVYGKHWEDDDVDLSLHTEGRDYGEYSTREYAQAMDDGKIDYQTEYREGARNARDRFLSIVEELRERGDLEDTFTVFTADHGECFPDDDCQGGNRHGKRCPHTMKVQTTFYETDVDVESPLRSVDILDLWDPWIENENDLVPRQEPSHRPSNEDEAVTDRLEALGYI